MTEQRVNVPLLRKAVEWAEAEAEKPPELCEWDQTVYRETEPQVYAGKDEACGTCYCIAGYVSALLSPEYAAGAGYPFDPSSFAADALGIDKDEASDPGGLFYDDNTIEDVRRIAEDIAGERL